MRLGAIRSSFSATLSFSSAGSSFGNEASKSVSGLVTTAVGSFVAAAALKSSTVAAPAAAPAAGAVAGGFLKTVGSSFSNAVHGFLHTMASVVLFAVGAFAWLNDKVTSQGERTIYTARCEQGEWQGNLCTGRLAPSERYRFRALKAHREVLFWTIGDNGPSGRFTGCDVVDGRNWSCRPNDDASRTITHEMTHGHPLPDAGVPTVPFHEIPKWKWMMLQVGLPVRNRAIGPS